MSETAVCRPGVSRRTLIATGLAASVGFSLLALWKRSSHTIADGIEARRDPRIVRSCQNFIDMLRLRGIITQARSANSIFVDRSAWQRLTHIEQVALSNAVAGRAFGKHAQYLSRDEAGYVYALSSGYQLAVARNIGVTLS